MLVASDDAASGSVIEKHERISPLSKGASHRNFCSGVPYMCSTSIFPVSGAEQLNTSEAQTTRPMISACGAYSRLVLPEMSGRKRFHNPAAFALILRSSIKSSGCQRSPEFNSSPYWLSFG